MIREILMILFVTCSTLGSQLLIKHAVAQLALRSPPLSGMPWLFAAVLSPTVIAAIAVQGIGFLVWVVVVSRVKLGVAFAISGAFFYLLMALATWLLYDERLTPWQWIGIALISALDLAFAFAFAAQGHKSRAPTRSGTRGGDAAPTTATAGSSARGWKPLPRSCDAANTRIAAAI